MEITSESGKNNYNDDQLTKTSMKTSAHNDNMEQISSNAVTRRKRGCQDYAIVFENNENTTIEMKEDQSNASILDNNLLIN